jgi:hypothetical protein
MLLHLIIALIVIGALLYIVQLLPIDATFKRVIQVIAIVAAVIWSLKVLMPVAGLG